MFFLIRSFVIAGTNFDPFSFNNTCERNKSQSVYIFRICIDELRVFPQEKVREMDTNLNPSYSSR